MTVSGNGAAGAAAAAAPRCRRRRRRRWGGRRRRPSPTVPRISSRIPPRSRGEAAPWSSSATFVLLLVFCPLPLLPPLDHCKCSGISHWSVRVGRGEGDRRRRLNRPLLSNRRRHFSSRRWCRRGRQYHSLTRFDVRTAPLYSASCLLSLDAHGSSCCFFTIEGYSWTIKGAFFSFFVVAVVAAAVAAAATG